MDDLERAALEAEAVAYDRPPDAPDVPVREQCGDWVDGYERGAMAAARAIRALPRSEWRDRPPTRAEINAHASVHGDGHGYGLWMHAGPRGGSRIVELAEWRPVPAGRYRPCMQDLTPVPWPEVPRG